MSLVRVLGLLGAQLLVLEVWLSINSYRSLRATLRKDSKTLDTVGELPSLPNIRVSSFRQSPHTLATRKDRQEHRPGLNVGPHEKARHDQPHPENLASTRHLAKDNASNCCEHGSDKKTASLRPLHACSADMGEQKAGRDGRAVTELRRAHHPGRGQREGVPCGQNIFVREENTEHRRRMPSPWLSDNSCRFHRGGDQ